MAWSLFGEMSDTGAIGIAGISSLLGIAATWLYTKWKEVRDDKRKLDELRRKEVKEDQAELREIETGKEKTITQHLEAVNARITTENTELRLENREIRATLLEVIGHLKYLEGLLEAKGIPFRPLTLKLLERSDMHKPLDNNQKQQGAS